MANRGKMRQIADVKRSKIVVEIGVFYYRLPWVTLGNLGCRGLEAGRQLLTYAQPYQQCLKLLWPVITLLIFYDLI